MGTGTRRRTKTRRRPGSARAWRGARRGLGPRRPCANARDCARPAAFRAVCCGVWGAATAGCVDANRTHRTRGRCLPAPPRHARRPACPCADLPKPAQCTPTCTTRRAPPMPHRLRLHGRSAHAVGRGDTSPQRGAHPKPSNPPQDPERPYRPARGKCGAGEPQGRVGTHNSGTGARGAAVLRARARARAWRLLVANHIDMPGAEAYATNTNVEGILKTRSMFACTQTTKAAPARGAARARARALRAGRRFLTAYYRPPATTHRLRLSADS